MEETALQQLKNTEEEVSRLLDQAKELDELAASFISKQSSEEQLLCQKASALDSNLRRLWSLINSSRDFRRADQAGGNKLKDDLLKARTMMVSGMIASFLPQSVQGSFLRAFLGPVNVRATRKDVQLKFKEEFNSYRDRTALLFLLFPTILLILKSWVWRGCLPAFPVQIYQAWLLFLYIGLALRENILKANGSDIRPWWIYHHYFAMVMAVVSLTWDFRGREDCIQKQRGVQLFLQWAIMQGVAMLLQNRYQRRRLYTRIALGKAKTMDVVWGETAGVDGQLLLLCPILFTLQGFEAYLGLMLLKTALAIGASEWQVSFCGVLLVIMAVGNFVNTMQTLIAKSKIKAKAKRSKPRRTSD